MNRTATRMARVLAPALALAAGLAAFHFAGGAQASTSGAPLVYTCPGVQDGQEPNCQYGQEFEVFDRNGAPVFSVPEAGPAGAFGTCLASYRPGDVYDPSAVTCYADPVTYYRSAGVSAACRAPAAWFAPGGIWSCTTSGTWVKKASF